MTKLTTWLHMGVCCGVEARKVTSLTATYWHCKTYMHYTILYQLKCQPPIQVELNLMSQRVVSMLMGQY